MLPSLQLYLIRSCSSVFSEKINLLRLLIDKYFILQMNKLSFKLFNSHFNLLQTKCFLLNWQISGLISGKKCFFTPYVIISFLFHLIMKCSKSLWKKILLINFSDQCWIMWTCILFWYTSYIVLPLIVLWFFSASATTVYKTSWHK